MAAAQAHTGGQVLTVTAAGRRFALRAADIGEIIRPPALTRCPLSPGSLMGIANLRGAVLPVVSLASLAGGEPCGEAPARTASSRVVVVEHPAHIGLWVDAMPVLAPAAGDPLVPLTSWLDRDFGASLAAAQADRRPPGAADAPAAPPSEMQLLAFSAGGQDYALALQDVREAIAMPPGLTRLAGTGPEMLGATRHRSALLPVVCLPQLLGLPAAAPAAVVVTRIGAHAVGFAVDRLQAILRVPETAIDQVPPVLTRGRGEARISAICRHRDGRLIAILSPGGLFDPATVERLLAAAAPVEQAIESTAEAASERFVGFRLGAEHYGVPAATVMAVMRRPATVTRIPHATDVVCGLINLRGQAIPLIDPRARFGSRPGPAGAAPFVMIVAVQGRQAGLCVDALTGMARATRAQLAAAPALSSATPPVIDRIACLEREGRMIILVDPAALLTTAAAEFLAARADRQAPAA